MDYLYKQYTLQQTQNIQEEEKVKAFLERIAPFAEISTLEEAKTLAKQILPTKTDVTSFYIGKLKCTVVNRQEELRISIDTEDEFICYSFS